LRKGEDHEAILTTAIMTIMIVAACRTAAEGCLWLGVIDSLISLIIWHAAVVLTRVTWMGSWFWKQEPRLHDVTWACEAITSMAHLLPLLMALGHLVLYCGYSGVKITVSKLGFKYTVPEGKGGDGGVVIQTTFGKLHCTNDDLGCTEGRIQRCIQGSVVMVVCFSQCSVPS
jgi:hypothetical protein